MKPATLDTFQVLVAAAGTPQSLGASANIKGLLATNLTIWPGKGANGRTANTGLVYVGFGQVKGPTFGTAEVASGTLLGTVTAAGNASVSVTSAFIVGSPLVVPVAVANTDTPTTYAAKIVIALNATPSFAAAFVASSVGAILSVTRAPGLSGQDSTLAFTVATGTATGITSVTSTITTTAANTDVVITPPTIWMPIAVAPTVPFQLFPDLIAGSVDLATMFVDAASSGDGITVLALLNPDR